MSTVARVLRTRTGARASGETALRDALGAWEQRLTLERLRTWLIRGAVAALVVACGVLLVGWVTPIPEGELHPWAAAIGLIPLLIATGFALSPRPHLHHAAELDQRLGFGDRLATAWSFRESEQPIARLQRVDALNRLQQRAPGADLHWRPARLELFVVGGAALVTLLLLLTPSPQQKVLDQQAAEQNSVLQTGQQLDALRQAADASSSLTPDQARQLDELLQQAQADLNNAHTQQDATAILARTQDQVNQQLGDPNADLRDEALAAMSETLAAEPQTQALASALQQENPQATGDAMHNIAAQADSLSDVERQSLSRALQRAANVGRADSRSANALANAAQAIASGASADAALNQADAALRDSIQASQSQAAVDATAQRLHDLQARLASGTPLSSDANQPPGQGSAMASVDGNYDLASGTPVALDSGASQTVSEPTTGQNSQGAGVGAGASGQAGQAPPDAQAAENVFVPGRPGNGPADQDLVNQPFSVSGAPRPYRDVLNQYAQSSRDYVDRPDISPAVRDLVKQYFQELENNQ
ncbi:MAG: hypothetical protein JOZ87_06845 [Chloroflexi bacterium]|nr:hypothetical protein [Chloroflexota bacterium]